MIKNEQDLSCKTFRLIAEEWLEKKRIRLKHSSIEKYENLLNKHILIRIGSLEAKDFNTQVFEQTIEDISTSIINNKHLSTSSMKSIVYIINSIIKYGVRYGYNDPVLFQFEYKNDHFSKPKVIPHPDQDKMILHIKNNPSMNNLGILLSITTGLRLGEICALQYKDINFDSKTIHICKTVQRIRTVSGTKLISSPPKTYNSNRYIPIPLIVQEYINSFNIIDSATNSQHYLLSDSVIPYEPRTLQYSFKRLLIQCDIDDINFHCLRHTFATNCVEVGFEIKTLSEILGHSSVSFTLNRYVHSSIIQKANQMKLLDKKYESLF